MGIRINTNVASINTTRHLFNSTQAFAKSMEKLSSGLRINLGELLLVSHSVFPEIHEELHAFEIAL